MPNTESNSPDAAILTESPLPPAREKLADALSRILEYKDFNSITNAEISRAAGVNESLIYRYFENKRGLLHQVLHDYMLDFQAQVQQDLKSSQGALDKLRSLIQVHIRMYDSNRVLARILLLEVRNFPGYFESETYQLVQTYGRLVMQIIREGMANGEIRDDVAPARVRDLILGSIEHFCMAPVIFGHEIDSGADAGQLGALIFSGIEKKADGAG